MKLTYKHTVMNGAASAFDSFNTIINRRRSLKVTLLKRKVAVIFRYFNAGQPSTFTIKSYFYFTTGSVVLKSI